MKPEKVDEEMSKKLAEKALDEYLYNGKSIREWMQIIASEDAISRRELLIEIESVCFSKGWAKFRADNGSNGTRNYIINYIKEMSPVTSQPKIERWIPTWEWTDSCAIFKCSNCSEFSKFRFKYCPNCGTKMEVEE